MKKMLQAPSAKMIIWILVVATFSTIWFPQEGRAMLAPAVLAQESNSGLNRGEDLQRVQHVLESKVLQQRLKDLGLTEKEINTRLSLLSDNQLHQMASQIDAQMPGGDAGLGIIITVLVIAVLVVLFLYLARRV
jgi:hypothetical protein